MGYPIFCCVCSICLTLETSDGTLADKLGWLEATAVLPGYPDITIRKQVVGSASCTLAAVGYVALELGSASRRGKFVG